MDRMRIAKKLVELRGEATQAEIAKAVGVAQSTYAMYEIGKRVPTDEIKIKIAEHYHKTVQEIFFEPIPA